jgi:hypothetical protein
MFFNLRIIVNNVHFQGTCARIPVLKYRVSMLTYGTLVISNAAFDFCELCEGRLEGLDYGV